MSATGRQGHHCVRSSAPAQASESWGAPARVGGQPERVRCRGAIPVSERKSRCDLTSLPGVAQQSVRALASPLAGRDVDGDERRCKARSSADAERPARAARVRHPSDDRRSDGRASECDGDAQRHHAPSHGRLGRELHQAVRRVRKSQGSHADDDERGGEKPIARRERRQRAAETEYAGADQQQVEPRLVALGAQQGARHRPDRHDRRQQAIAAGVCMENTDGHCRDEDREVEAEGSDQEQHDQDRLEIRAAPHVAEPFGEAALGALRAGVGAKLGDAQEGEGDQHSDERSAVHQEGPAGPDRGNDQARHGRADHPRRIERGRIERYRIVQVFVPDQFGDECLPDGRIERRRTAEQEGEDVDVPELYDAGDGENPQCQRETAHRRLSGDQELSLVEMIGDETRPWQKQQLRPELQRHDQADSGGVVIGELGEHEPVLGRSLHPGADVGDEGARSPDPIVEPPQRPKDAGEGSLHDCSGWLPP